MNVAPDRIASLEGQLAQARKRIGDLELELAALKSMAANWTHQQEKLLKRIDDLLNRQLEESYP